MTLLKVLKLSVGIVIVLVFVVVLFFAKYVRDYATKNQDEAVAHFEAINSHKTFDNLPGVQAMQQARSLLQEGNNGEARERLIFTINFYWDAPFASTARQILGEMNLDQLFHPSNLSRKEVHQVVPGDSLSRIAGQYDTTAENIMALNALSYSNRIQPGQELSVMPLRFTTVIDVNRKTLTLKDAGTFIKEYPLKKVVINSQRKSLALRISKSLAQRGGKTYSTLSPQYRFASKLILLNAGGLQIRAVPHPDDPEYGAGFFLSEEDMQEYALLVKTGNEVEIRL